MSLAMGLNCVAAGTYVSTATNNPQYMMALISTDGGETWAYTLDSATPTPTDYVSQLYNLGGLSCSGSSCAVAATYTTNTDESNYYPLIYTSLDNGQTWNYTFDSSSPSQQTMIQRLIYLATT